jgi:hypothetical protein
MEKIFDVAKRKDYDTAVSYLNAKAKCLRAGKGVFYYNKDNEIFAISYEYIRRIMLDTHRTSKETFSGLKKILGVAI